MSMDFVQMITTIRSMPSMLIEVHRQGPAAGVTPVLIPLMPRWPNIRCVLYHL